MTWVQQVCPDCKQYLSPNTNLDETCDGCGADMRAISSMERKWVSTRTDGRPWIPGSLL